VIRAISHKLSSEELPTWRACAFNNETLPQGYTKRVSSSAGCELKIIRDIRVPLAYYQGCATIDVQAEYENGLVYTGLGGGVTGDEKSDTHEVMLTMAFRTLDELLPEGVVSLL
jgi:hypothetical protein